MNAQTVTSEQDETLSHVVWRTEGRNPPQRLEQVLTLNPHLRNLPAALPAGTPIYLPPPPAAAPPLLANRQLWD